MSDQRSAPREGLLAVATFGGIALATALAIDFLVTGGFEIVPERQHSPYIDPFAFASASAAEPNWQDTSTDVTWMEPMPIETPPPRAITTEVMWTHPAPIEPTFPVDELAGGRSGETAAVEPAVYETALSEDELYREIAALYAAEEARSEAPQETAAVFDASPPLGAEPLEDALPVLKGDGLKKPSGDETASPW